MVKVASIDLGSNSTRMLIADITNGTITTIYKEHQVTRMADKLSESKIISKEATKRVLKVLAGYVKTINKNNVENIQVVGTAALRDATNITPFFIVPLVSLDIRNSAHLFHHVPNLSDEFGVV